MTNAIVVLTVTQQLAPLPPTLQKSGAFVSQGGTTLAPGTYLALPTKATLATVLNAGMALSSLTSSGLTATATTAESAITSGTYNNTTGAVSLVLSRTIGAAVGSKVTIAALTGTGAFASLDGDQTATVGTGGTTLNFMAAASLGAATITGGTATLDLTDQVGNTFLTTITGASPAAYNGTFLATVTGADTFTYQLAATTTSPATGSITYSGPNVAELVAANNTWWSQINAGNLAPYVLELGPGENAAAITALNTYITNNPNSAYVPGAQGFFYGYLVPKSWSGESSYLTFLATYNNPTSKVKFWTTMTLDNYSNFTNLDTCVIGLVEAPGTPTSEFSLCSGFYVALNYNPTTTSKVPPLNNAYVYGVTPYPTAGNIPTLTALKNAGVNWIGTGAEGGITLTTFVFGTTMDGISFNWEYSVDWAQINVNVDVANAVINGSNTDTNPLYYNPEGIARLQAVAAATLQRGIGSGLILGQLILTELDPQTFITNVNNGLYNGNCVINAVPFQTWLDANPSTYVEGVYGGFTVLMTPQLGFTQIIFNLDVTQFA